MSLPRPALVLIALWALALGGCLGDPEPLSCADLPPDSPGCGDDGGPDDMDPVDAPDTGPDAARPADGAPPADMSRDAGPDADSPDDPDMGAADMGDPDGGEPDSGGSECEPGTDRACGSDEGACVTGRQFCNAEGRFEACLGAVDPTDEACNGLDDDCDGNTDEGCDCVGGTTQPCGSDVGACSFGEQTCVAGAWSACEGAIDGGEEICDGVDNDCDGEVDNVPVVVEMRPCTAGVGACAESGVLECRPDVDTDPVCNAEAGAPVGESCNRQDDDCDGSTDEDIQSGTVRLVAGEEAELIPAAIAPRGEFHGVAWVEDGRVFFGLALGNEWEVSPVEIDGYDGGDSGGAELALANADDGFRLAVSSWNVGSGALGVHSLNPGGQETRYYNVSNSQRDGIDIAHRSDFGYALAFVDDDSGHDIAVDVVPDDAGQMPTRYIIDSGAAHLRQPSVVWADDDVAVAAVNADPRGAETGNIQLSIISGLGGIPRTTVLERDGSAANPDLIWLPRHQRFVVAWDVAGRIRDSRAVRVAIVDPAGEVESTFDLAEWVSAVEPSLMARIGAREPADTIAVAVKSAQAQAFTIRMGWLTWRDGRWSVSPTTTQVANEQGEGTGPSAARSDVYGVAHIRDDGRSRQMVFSTVDACPERP